MAQPEDTQTPYYAKDGMVWKHPIETMKLDGTLSITIGFPVCKMHDAVGEDAAEAVAQLMNIGHQHQPK